MKAILQHGYGSPDLLELAEIDRLVPEEDEVLVRVHAAAVNHADWETVRGHPLMRMLEGPTTPRNPVRGSDVAGSVEAVGKNVTVRCRGHSV